MNKLKIGFIGNFRVPYTTENDRKWSFEKLGHEVIAFQENETTESKLYEMASELDVLFYSHTHGWEIPNLKKVFEYYKNVGIPTVSVHLDRWAWLDRAKDMGQEATWFTEYIFMADGSPEAVKLYKNLKLNWYWLKPGVVERDCFLAEPNKVKFPHDIVFVGSKGYHPEYAARPKLIDFLQETYGDRFGHYGNDGIRVVRGDELNELYASSQIAVGDSCFGGRPRYVSDRYYETRGRGGFLIHPEIKGDDTESIGIDFYEPGNFSSLKDVIDKYLFEPKVIDIMRLAGHDWVKNHETYTHRAQEMLQIIFPEVEEGEVVN